MTKSAYMTDRWLEIKGLRSEIWY